MGNAFGLNQRVRTDDTVFVIPANVRLSRGQRAQLAATGQETGIPFVVSESGASRATSNHVKRATLRNLVAVKRDSLKFIDCGEGMRGLSFIYDASVPAMAFIYIKARDGCSSTGSTITVTDANVTWGPVKLAEGCDIVYNSSTTGLLIHESVVLSDKSKNSKDKFRIGKPYDVILHLLPDTGAAGAQPRPRMGLMGIFGGKKMEAVELAPPTATAEATAVDMAELGPGPRDRDGKNDEGEVRLGSPVNTTMAAPKTIDRARFTGLTCTRQLAVNLGDAEDEHEDDHPSAWKALSAEDEDEGAKSDVKMQMVEIASTRQARQPWLRARIRGSPEPLKKEVHYSSAASAPSSSSALPRNVARSEITYACFASVAVKNPAASPSAPSSRAKLADGDDADSAGGSENAPTAAPTSSMALRTTLQRLHVGNTLFVMHEIYGIDVKTGATASTTEAGATNGEPPEPAEIADCVICLSSARSVFVYPCRHMCLCAECAETMPAQSIKCPMCRNPAKMLVSVAQPAAKTV